MPEPLFKICELVRVARKPTNIYEGPSWVREMDKHLHKEFKVRSLCVQNKGASSEYIEYELENTNYVWRESWLEKVNTKCTKCPHSTKIHNKKTCAGIVFDSNWEISLCACKGY